MTLEEKLDIWIENRRSKGLDTRVLEEASMRLKNQAEIIAYLRAENDFHESRRVVG